MAEDLDEFAMWSVDVQAFADDANADKLVLPPGINSKTRWQIHSLAEELGLSHASTGGGSARHLVLRKANASSHQQGSDETDELSQMGRHLFKAAVDAPPAVPALDAIAISVVTANGTSYALGEVSASTTILNVKEKLARISPIR